MKRIRVKRVLFGFGLALVGLLSGCLLLTPSAPENLYASDGEYPEFVLVRWDPAPRASRYEVFRASDREGPYERIGEASTPRFEDRTAAPNVLYWYKVRACNNFGCSGLSQADAGFWLGQAPPLPPKNLQASDGTFENRIRVTWDPSLGASHYELYRSDVPGADFVRIAVVGDIAYDDTEVVRGRTYWYKVKACNAYGCSEFSEPDSGVAAGQTPAAPTNVQASDGTFSDRVRVSWDPVPGAAGYEVHRAPAQAGPYERIGETTAPTTTFDDTGVTPGTTYWYRVRAWNVLGYGPFSEPDAGYAAAAGGGGGGGGGALLPGQPRNLSATDGVYDDKIVVTWSAASGAKRYELWRAPATGPADPPPEAYVLVAELTSTSYTDTAPALCELVWYKVRAWNEHGYGPWSYPDSGYKGGKLDAVDTTKIKVRVLPPSGTEGYRVYLEWANVKNAVKYDVVYEVWRRGPAGYSTKIAEVSPTITGGQAVDPVTYVDSTVELGTTYYYKIRAKSGLYANLSCAGCGVCIPPGGFSGEVAAVVACNPLPPELKTVTYDAATKKITLTWTDPYAGTPLAGVAQFEVWRKRSPAEAEYVRVAQGVSGLSWTDENPLQGLASGKTYTISYKVKTCLDCGCGVFSNEKSVSVQVP